MVPAGFNAYLCISVYFLKKSQPKTFEHNSLTHKAVLAGTKNSRSEAFDKLNTQLTKIHTMMSCFPLQQHGFDRLTHRTLGSFCRRGWVRPPSEDFSRINKLKEKLIYFSCLSVNDNNCLPAVGNDSQNSINCCWRAAIICKLNNYIVRNTTIAWIYF